jgi:arsenate reductase
LQGLFAAAGLMPRAALRLAQGRAAALGLLGEDTILSAMVADPELVERLVVCSPRGVRLCRPPERVLPLLTPV